jgi:hypothetical protein
LRMRWTFAGGPSGRGAWCVVPRAEALGFVRAGLQPGDDVGGVDEVGGVG